MNDDKKFILAVPRVWYNKRERMYYCFAKCYELDAKNASGVIGQWQFNGKVDSMQNLEDVLYSKIARLVHNAKDIKNRYMYWEYCREHNIETIVVSPANVKNKRDLVW